MKKILGIALGTFVVFEGFVYATNQPQRLGSAALQSLTAAQIRVLTGNTTGQILYCSDCLTNAATGAVCVSTGSTAANQFIFISSGTVCK